MSEEFTRSRWTRGPRNGRSDMPGGGVSKVKQADEDSTNINVIMKKYLMNDVAGMVNPTMPMYGDFTNSEDYFTQRNKQIAAQSAFDDLPSKVRSHVDNDPGKFMDLIQDASRRDELIELGMIEENGKIVVPVKDPEPVVPPVVPTGGE